MNLVVRGVPHEEPGCAHAAEPLDGACWHPELVQLPVAGIALLVAFLVAAWLAS